MRAILLMLALFVLLPGLARAGVCYTPQEYEADRGLRLHEDIEVIMLTCRYSTQGQPLTKVYAGIMKEHSGQIAKWEGIIARSYGGGGGRGGRNEVIDNFKTKLANQKANEVGAMGARPFCAQWADFVPYVAALSPEQFMDYVRKPDPTRPTRRPLCGG